VVLYKVDRLTRSLADFVRLVEIFDAQGGSFVSVTQHFNTTSSMGRLTLNVLLSFAQFEREVLANGSATRSRPRKRRVCGWGTTCHSAMMRARARWSSTLSRLETMRRIFALYPELGSVRWGQGENTSTYRRTSSAVALSGDRKVTRDHRRRGFRSARGSSRSHRV
jgi:hypothetical protein